VHTRSVRSFGIRVMLIAVCGCSRSAKPTMVSVDVRMRVYRAEYELPSVAIGDL